MYAVGLKTTDLHWPRWAVYAILPIGMVLFALRAGEAAVMILRGRRDGLAAGHEAEDLLREQAEARAADAGRRPTEARAHGIRRPLHSRSLHAGARRADRRVARPVEPHRHHLLLAQLARRRSRCRFFQSTQGYTLLAIPFFILASNFMSTGGVARRIIRFAIACVGQFRGGLAMAGVFACMLFAALSGSSPATVVAIGTIAIAGMRQVGYSKEFAAGVIANAGTLGILIPPSIVMVVYCAATDVSVGRMFLAGIIPGIVAGLMLMVGDLRRGAGQGSAGAALRRLGRDGRRRPRPGFGLFLVVIILGGIYGGVFTPTEAAAVAAVYAFLVAIFVYRDMGPLKGVPGGFRTSRSERAAPQPLPDGDALRARLRPSRHREGAGRIRPARPSC